MNINFISSIEKISAEQWNALLGENEPFLRHEFLRALETSQSVSRSSGWEPYHAVCRDDMGALLAVSPLYIKSHSYGEYVFDWAWADAYQRHGLSYYPKLVSAIPFTPSQSQRLLFKPALKAKQRVELATLFLKTLEHECEREGFSSAHVLFPSTEQVDSALYKPWMERRATQYHWLNRSYSNFDGFLAELNSSKRKNIRKERRGLVQSGITTRWYCVDDLDDTLRNCFYACYENTYHRRGQHPYLSKNFFDLLFKAMPKECLLLFAFDSNEQPIACALFIKGSDTLFGRYWGCLDEQPYLHFELCYYQGIEYCIKHDLSRFDAGAQGEHKLLRGFEPVCTYSYHYIQHQEFAHAIDQFLEEEKEYVEQHREQAKDCLPYKKVT